MRPLIVSIQLDGEEKCTNGGTGRVKESNKIFYIEKYSKSFLRMIFTVQESHWQIRLMPIICAQLSPESDMATFQKELRY